MTKRQAAKREVKGIQGLDIPNWLIGPWKTDSANTSYFLIAQQGLHGRIAHQLEGHGKRQFLISTLCLYWKNWKLHLTVLLCYIEVWGWVGAKESGKDFSYAFSATFIETLTKILIFKISFFCGLQLKSDLEYKDIQKGVMSLKTRNQGKRNQR